jgi:hypothetical protein
MHTKCEREGKEVQAESDGSKPNGDVKDLDRPINEHPHFFGYAGWLPGESYLSAAKRVLKELQELENHEAAKGKQV